MQDYNFYEIRSKKSEEFVKGVRKVSLVCENRPDIHCFLWIDQERKLKHVQFLFDEKLIEWIEGRKNIITSHTNRQMASNRKPGIHKGARTIHTVDDSRIMEEGLQIIKSAEFPENYEQQILHKFA